MLHNSPYARVLSERKFIELDPETCKLLKDDWTIRPQMRYLSVQAMPGAIMLNEANSNAVLLNCVEGYRRTSSVDAHRERFASIKGYTPQHSLPPPSSRYANVWPCTIADNDGQKLVIGTQTANLLVTSSIRTDTKMLPSVWWGGGTTYSFALPEKTGPASTCIYLNVQSLEKASMLAKDENTVQLETFHIFNQLRQLRSKYHRLSTYLLCRAPSCFAIAHSRQPYTVYTIGDSDSSDDDTDYKMASRLFKQVASQVLLKSHDAQLEVQVLERLEVQISNKGLIQQAPKSILETFPEDTQSISIIENKDLANALGRLATLLSSKIATANQTVATAIMEVFPQ